MFFFDNFNLGIHNTIKAVYSLSHTVVLDIFRVPTPVGMKYPKHHPSVCCFYQLFHSECLFLAKWPININMNDYRSVVCEKLYLQVPYCICHLVQR